MVINALICDDEIQYIDKISKCLNDFCYDHSITYKAEAFTNGLDAINSVNTYNIAFLDIEIDNISGLEIAKALKERNKNLIVFFITAYEKYIDDAMDLFAFRFIKKPLNRARLYKGLEKAVSLINEEEISIYLKDSKAIQNIKASDIMYIEIGDHKTMISTEDQIYNSSESLDYWETKLTNVCFCRPHKSFILNMKYIDKYQRNEVTLTNGNIIPIAYRKQKEFRKIFGDYLKRRK